MTFAILKITDGTTTIDLLETENGFLLDSWYPALQIPKSGGVWHGSPLTDGRRLAMRHYDNAIETFNITLNKDCQDTIIYALQDLFRLLDKAVYYWITRWQNDPVWIEARAKGETNTRYALITDYRIAGLPNPYAQPFANSPTVMDDLTLTLEHDYWTEEAPGTATAIEISAQQDYNGTTYGQEATSLTEMVTIANKHVQANITNVKYYDVAPVPHYVEIFGSALPYAYLPAVPATGDQILWGCDTSIANSGPFSGVILYLSTAAANITDVDWYYRNAGGWQPLTVYTDLAGAGGGGQFFTGTGFRYIAFEPPSDWIPNNVNGDTCYWIMGEITAIGGATPPYQGSRDFYAPVVPFVDIDSLQVPGDVPSLTKLIITNYMGIASLPNGTQDVDIYAGSRTLSRGSTFTPFINLGDEQNISGISITAGTDTAIATYIPAPTGRSYRWQAASAAEAMRVRVNIAQAIRSTYQGRYIALLRCYAADAGTTSVFLRVHYGTSAYSLVFESQTQFIEAGYNELKFGVIELPGTDATNDTLYISIIGSDADSTNDIYFFDLILMPADEWLARYHTEWYNSTNGLSQNDFLIIDSISSPKDYHTAVLYSKEWVAGLPSNTKGLISVNAAGQSLLQSNVDQRLWFLIIGTAARNFPLMSVSASRMARYLAMRGNR